MGTIVQIVKIVKGEPCIIQANNSQVKLLVPKGVHAVVLGNIHTIYSKFLHLIPDSECIVGPMCEYSVHTFIDGSQIHSSEKFQLQVPHMVNNIFTVLDQLKVQEVSQGAIVTTLVKAQNNMSDVSEDSYFYADKRYINIFTSHFSTFLVTAENTNCCAGSANVLLYGSLINFPDENTVATIKVYLSSVHSKIQDYEDVSTLHFLLISIPIPWQATSLIFFKTS